MLFTNFFKKTILFVFLISFFTLSHGQNALEFEANSYSGSIPNGPTTTNQTVTFRENTSGSTFVAYTPTITATASFSNQQFTANAPAINRGLSFGGDINGSGTNMGSTSVFPTMNNVGSPSNASFTTLPFGTAGTGIAVNLNRGFNFFVSARPLAVAGAAANGRYYYGNITITFNRPVSNPNIHFVGMGGFTGSQGMTAEFENITSGVTITRLSGSTEFTISGNDITNNATNPNSNCGSGGACGTIRVNSHYITSVTFRVFLRGNGGGNWGPAIHAGDRVIISVSLEKPVDYSGNVRNDANGLTDNIVNGTGTNAGGLNAILVDNFNIVRQSTSVPAGGAFSFLGVWRGTYTVLLSTTAGVVGSAPPTVSLPAGWLTMGENLGAGAGSDGTPNSILSVTSTITNINNINFGIERPPVPTGRNILLNPSPTYLTSASLTPANSLLPLAGTDPEDGAKGSGNDFRITDISGLNGNELYYNGVLITGPITISNYNPNLLTISFVGHLSTSADFRYNTFDAAGILGTSDSLYRIRWLVPLPVTLISFNISENENNFVELTWETASEENNAYFEIERSTDPTFSSFNVIGRIQGNGTTYNRSYYSLVDENPIKGTKSFYRLKQIDLDGTVSYLGTRTILINHPLNILFPNPTTDNINITGIKESKLYVWDCNGIEQNFSTQYANGLHTISGLKPGIYFIRIITISHSSMFKVQVL